MEKQQQPLASLSALDPYPQTPAPAYSEVASSSTSASGTLPSSLRPGNSLRKPVPSADAAAAAAAAAAAPSPSPYRSQAKPLPIPYSPAQPTMSSAYPPSEHLPNPHTTRAGQHDYTDAYNHAELSAEASGNGYGNGHGHGHAQDLPASSSPEPATGPTKGVGVPSSYNAFISFPLLAPWYPASPAKQNGYYDPNVSGPRIFPPPLESRGLSESRFMQIQHFACSIRADSQRNKGLLCCGLGILLGGLGCVLIDNKCVGNKPLRDKVNRWAFENVNPRLENDGIEIRFAYQKGMLRAYFKD